MDCTWTIPENKTSIQQSANKQNMPGS